MYASNVQLVLFIALRQTNGKMGYMSYFFDLWMDIIMQIFSINVDLLSPLSPIFNEMVRCKNNFIFIFLLYYYN